MSESSQKELRIRDIQQHGEEIAKFKEKVRTLEEENGDLRQALYEAEAKLAEFELETPLLSQENHIL